MILRKPYAFLIRHFKIIHLLLLLPLCYIAFKTSNVLDFFERMVANNYVTNEVNIASNYINLFVYLSLIIIVSSSIFIYSLMKEKNKKTFYYIFLIVYYALLFICTSLTYGQLFNLENHDAIASTIRLFRDFSRILYYPQFLFIAYTLFRGVGFDIKSFNFIKDLEELELDDNDDEEVEISFGKNSYKYKRSFRKTIRELKYYILENKFVFLCILGVIIIILGSTLYMNIEVYNKKYGLNQAFSSNGLIISVNDSKLTNLSYDGTTISNDNYYLAIKVAIANRTKQSKDLDITNFRLYLGNHYIYPILDKSNKFLDYGSCYFGGTILPETSSEYIIVFEIPQKYYRKSYTLRVLDSIIYNIGEIHPKYRLINLNPSIETKVEDMGSVSKGTKVSLIDTTLGQSSFTINDYYFDNKFNYTYEKCINDNCREYNGNLSTSTSIYLILDANIDLDEKSYYYKNKVWRKNFFSDFIKLKYNYQGIEYNGELIDKTPDNYQGSYMIFQVPKSVSYATDLKLELNIRNRKATINLTESP